MKIVHSKPRMQHDQPPFPGYRLFLLLFFLIVAAIGYHIWAGPEYPVVIGPDGKDDLAPDRKRKLERELEEIDNAQQYALVATASKFYPCYSCPSGKKTIFLNKGEVWKYGVTRKGETGRYPNGKFGASDITFLPQFFGHYGECLRREKIMIYNYPLLPEARSRKITLLRPPGNTYDHQSIKKQSAMVIPEEKQIYVSGRIWHELYPKVDPYPFLYVLNQQIDLSKYGDGIRKYYFTFIAATPDDKLNLPGTHYSRKRRAAEIAVKLPYKHVVSGSKPEVIKLMEAAYLEGIDQIKTLPLKSNFDVAAFKHDVKAIFAEEGWYLQALEQ